MGKIGIVVGLEGEPVKAYRVIIGEIQANNGYIQWGQQFTKQMISDEEMRNILINRQLKFLNVGIGKDGKVKGTSGELSRFRTKGMPSSVVLLSMIENSAGACVGYKVANFNGDVKNIVYKEVLAYCDRMTRHGGTPIQNAIYVPKDSDGNSKIPGHIKSYPGYPILKEIMQVGKVEKPVRKSEATKNEKNLTRLEEIYTKEQIRQLKIGKEHGLDIREYANPELSAEHMKVLREAMEKGINIRGLTNPKFKVPELRFYITDLEQGLDISSYLNPEFDIHQLYILSVCAEFHFDISKILNPSIPASEMQEVYERMKENFQKEYTVIPDKSWNQRK